MGNLQRIFETGKFFICMKAGPRTPLIAAALRK